MDPLALVGLILLALGAALLVLLRTRPGGVVARVLLRPLVRLVYSFHVEGGGNVPRRGGALLVANHVSYADAFLLGACVDRPVRFLMHRSFLSLPLVGAFTRWVGAIPVASGDTPEERERALGAAAEALRRGELVAIFAEGRITRTGTLLGFRRGLETIAQQAGAPIVPVALDEVWGSIFSFAGGRAVLKWPRRVPYRVRVSIGAPLPAQTPAHRVRDAIGELLARAAERRALAEPDLARAFVRTARLHAARVALVEVPEGELSFADLLAHALALGAELRKRLGAARRVGVLLPAGRPAVEVHLALALAGRTCVALDPGHGPAGVAELASRTGLEQVITAPEVLAELGWSAEQGFPSAELLEVEALRRAAARRLPRSARLARRPAWWIERRLRGLPRSADPAVVLATSGTAGAPRAAELSHAAIASNVRALALAGELREQDVVLGTLPFSHAFGYTVTLWAPLLSGAALVPLGTPVDGGALASAARRARASVLLGTPALLAAWLPRLEPGDVRSLRLAISGGEHLPSDLALAWNERLGGELYEGYGATELGPVVSVNLPDVERGGLLQRNHRPGSVGRALPGVAVRVVREADGELCDPDERGRVLVRGPGRMSGYLGDSPATARALHAGWYDTGDVGALDRDGFLLVVDRRERFSEVDGELVAHARIEDGLRAALSSPACQLAVVAGAGGGAPPLVVVHTPLAVTLERLREAALEKGLPPAAVPPARAWLEVRALPLQPSGKIDFKALREVVRAAHPARTP